MRKQYTENILTVRPRAGDAAWIRAEAAARELTVSRFTRRLLTFAIIEYMQDPSKILKIEV